MQPKPSANSLKSFTFQYTCDWEKFVKLEASLNRILQHPQNFALGHGDFTKVLDQVRELISIVELIKMERKSYASMQ
jgi:hypothetical protein